MKGGVFSGITVSTESLEAIMAGGIALATPGGSDMGARVETGYRFTLFDEPEAGWLDWSPDIFVIEEEKGQSACARYKHGQPGARTAIA